MYALDLNDFQERAGDLTYTEEPSAAVIPNLDPSNLGDQGSSPPLDPSTKGTQLEGLYPLGLAPVPALVSAPFYETVRNVQPPQSSQTPSIIRATRGVNSSSEVSRQIDGPSSPVMPIYPSNDTGDGDPLQLPDHIDSSISGSFPPPTGASHQRPLLRQPFPAQSFYHGPSVPPPTPYGQQSVPGPGFMGQYMTSQPSHPMALQSPVRFGYSHPFAHPVVHGQDTSMINMPYAAGSQPQHTPGYMYPPPTRPGSEGHSGDRGKSAPSHATPSTEGAGGPRLPASAPPITGSHMASHPYSPLHYPAASTGSGYPPYATHSFAHSTPGLYFSGAHAYPHSLYGRPPPSSEDPSKVGTWWYLPPGSAQQFESSAYRPYPMSGFQPSMPMRPEFDGYGSQSHAGPSSPPSYVDTSRRHVRPPRAPAQVRDRSHLPSPPDIVHASDPSRPRPSSPISKKRSPMSTSPPQTSRKPYHPNPPPNRSEWVMWVGNVPSDATHDELWRFFNQPAPLSVPPAGTSAVLSSRQVRSAHLANKGELWGGVLSIFLISRSNCAFINFDTEQHLLSAVMHFNGKPLRLKDSRCLRLVCRVRRKDDDLRAGVGGQRGMGLHTRWVIEQKERERGKNTDADGEDVESSGGGPSTPPSTNFTPPSSSDPSPPIPSVSPTDGPSGSQQSRDSAPRQGSSGNQSFTSTNSSFLTYNFPKRFFILKSLTQYDLNLSFERGIWATQPHNEEILDQAYRTSKDVLLIFGANKSGEFFGYARMAGPIFHSERVDPISWASRSSASTASARGSSNPPQAIKEEDETDRGLLLSPNEHRLVDGSPVPVTPGEKSRLKRKTSSKDPAAYEFNEKLPTAPPELHLPHKLLSYPKPIREADTLPEVRAADATGAHPRANSEDTRLLTNLQTTTLRNSPEMILGPITNADGVLCQDTLVGSEAFRQRDKAVIHDVNIVDNLPDPSRSEQRSHDGSISTDKKPEGWGREFKVEWLRSERLPFHRTRHLRNPWNHDREVKVSRDGTELEPNVGQQLLDEWDKPAPVEPVPSPPTSPASRGRGAKLPARSFVDGPTHSRSSSSQARRGSSSTGIGRGRSVLQS